MAAALFWTFALLAGLACTSAQLGDEISIEENPSIVQVEGRLGPLWVQQCAGIILTNAHVLCTASCMPSEVRRIRAGATNRGIGGVTVDVSIAVYHPSYGTLGQEGDIAVVRLASTLTLGDTMQQAAILGQGIEMPAGTEVELAGWGTTTGALLINVQLRSLKLNVIENEDCMITFIGIETITENMVCVGLPETQGRDFDSRDAGSPLSYSGTTVGLLSFGAANANDSLPLVGTAIGSYTSWIVDAASNL